jgi:hypothetical protein
MRVLIDNALSPVLAALLIRTPSRDRSSVLTLAGGIHRILVSAELGFSRRREWTL